MALSQPRLCALVAHLVVQVRWVFEVVDGEPGEPCVAGHALCSLPGESEASRARRRLVLTAAEDIHVRTEKPYIMASIGLLRLTTHESSQRMSLINHVPSGARAAWTASIVSAGWVMSCRQSNVRIRS